MALCGLLAGCNVVAMRRASYLDDFDDAGLIARDLQLGDDRLRVYHDPRATQGPTVLLLHGFGGGAIWQWAPTVEALASDHRLIVPDLLWFGGSSSSRADYSLAHQAQAMVALLDALGAERVHVVGVSYGGLVAWELAQLAPQRVISVTLMGAPARLLSDEERAAGLARLGAASYPELLLPSDVPAVARLLDLAYADPPWAPDWALAQVPDGMYSAWREEQAALLDAVHGPGHPIYDGTGAVRVPTLLVWGEDDPLYPVDIGRRLRDAIGPDACLAIFSPARHAPILEYPDAFRELVRSFVATHDPRPPRGQ